MKRLIDIENIDYVRLEDSLHCLEHRKGDEVECVICAPLVEAIPKDQYEARLKADMVAMLTEIQLEIEELDTPNNGSAYIDCVEIIQQKINALNVSDINGGKIGGTE